MSANPYDIHHCSINTVRIQLYVSALYVGRLQVEIFNLQISYTRRVGRLGGQALPAHPNL